MSVSVALTGAAHGDLTDFLLATPGQEDACFALWSPSEGLVRTSALVGDVILPEEGDRERHGNVSINACFFQRSLHKAIASKRGLVLIHSHLGPGWQDMSSDDFNTEADFARSTEAATDLPLVGMTLGTDGSWSARFWGRRGPRLWAPEWCESVRVLGKALQVTFDERSLPIPDFRPEFARTVSAWGPDAQAMLMRLRIGVVGAGSVGSMVAEALARMGVQRLTLLDFDTIELVNLDRTLHGSKIDVDGHRAKVDVLADGVRRGATATDFEVDARDLSVVESDGFKAALDCDILFSCVDRPWARCALNGSAFAHLIPVVDGGIAVETRANGTALRSADWAAHTVMPGRRCMECLGQFLPSDVTLERDGLLDDPTYISGLPKDHRLRRNENVFAFSMSVASMEVLQMLALVVAPSGNGNIGAKEYHFVSGSMESNYGTCHSTCLYPTWTAMGDRAPLKWTGQHPAAEARRGERRARQAASRDLIVRHIRQPWWRKMLGLVRGLFPREP
jgi:hypothetical protein